MYRYMAKVTIEILQGSAVTQTVLGGLTIYLQVVNLLQRMCAKNYENRLEVAADKVQQAFLAHPVGPVQSTSCSGLWLCW